MTPDFDAVAALLIEAGESEVIPRFKRLKAHEIETKSGPDDLVTAADIASEAFLSEQLGQLLPEAKIVGEEAVANDPDLIEVLSEPGYVWIIDPVDGTYNFAHGQENFAIIVGLARDRVMLGGWIHVPLQGKTVVGERGQGAYCEGRRLQVASPAPLSEMHAVLYAGPRKYPQLYARIKEVRPQLGPRSFARSAGMEYVGLVEGRVHYAMFTRQLPWDHAAGWLIHREAGGYGAYMDGTPYLPVEQAKPLLLAPDEATWHDLTAFFMPPHL